MRIRFSTRRFGEGYDTDEVDAFLDRCEQALVRRDGSLTAEEALGQRFTPRRSGYAMDEVDEFLDTVLVPMLKDPQAHPYDPEREHTVGAGRAANGPSSAEQRPGFFSRLFGGGH